MFSEVSVQAAVVFSSRQIPGVYRTVLSPEREEGSIFKKSTGTTHL